MCLDHEKGKKVVGKTLYPSSLGLQCSLPTFYKRSYLRDAKIAKTFPILILTVLTLLAFTSLSVILCALVQPVMDRDGVLFKTQPQESVINFIIFEKMELGQGIGNIMDGLLAAHMLGREFSRTVCVHPSFTHFHQAFELKSSYIQNKCSQMIDSINNNTEKIEQLKLINFASSPNECRMKEILQSDDHVVKIMGNTYPKWSKIPDNFFQMFYQPKKALLDILPYATFPNTVVHLRAPDGSRDKRVGLDDETFSLLGDQLPKDSFLVTNQVTWYTIFERKGWGHPPWTGVKHSAHQLSWSSQNTYTPEEEALHLWADWYTILKAKFVYHTWSDFSQSAIHWMNLPSKVIYGVDAAGNLQFMEESWRKEGEFPPIIDRVSPEDSLSDTDAFPLQNCNS